MCELFAMSSMHPATASFSLDEFARHGGLSGNNEDGWGVGFFQGNDVLLTRESGAACQSANLAFIRSQRIQSPLMIAHIRQANVGDRSLRNSQPFGRELGGRMHLFAHNGDLPAVLNQPFDRGDCFRPLGETDSEYAFCQLMNGLGGIWRDGTPELERRVAVFSAFALGMMELGTANLLYSDSEFLFALGHRRSRFPGGPIEPPGLVTLRRDCDFSQVGENPVNEPRIAGLDLEFGAQHQRVQLIASVPLSGEDWEPLNEGELLVIQHGAVVMRRQLV